MAQGNADSNQTEIKIPSVVRNTLTFTKAWFDHQQLVNYKG